MGRVVGSVSDYLFLKNAIEYQVINYLKAKKRLI